MTSDLTWCHCEASTCEAEGRRRQATIPCSVALLTNSINLRTKLLNFTEIAVNYLLLCQKKRLEFGVLRSNVTLVSKVALRPLTNPKSQTDHRVHGLHTKFCHSKNLSKKTCDVWFCFFRRMCIRVVWRTNMVSKGLTPSYFRLQWWVDWVRRVVCE